MKLITKYSILFIIVFISNYCYSQIKVESHYKNEITLGGGYANGFEEHVFNLPFDESVKSATGINLNGCYYFQKNMGIGIRMIGYYKELPEYILVDQYGSQEKVKFELFNYTADAEFRYLFSTGKIAPYGFILLGLSSGNVSGNDAELSFSGFNAGIGTGLRIPIGKTWRLSGELFATAGSASWEEKPFINSQNDSFNPSMTGFLINISYVW